MDKPVSPTYAAGSATDAGIDLLPLPQEQAPRHHGIDFIRASSSLQNADYGYNGTTNTGTNSARRSDYVTRRWELFESSDQSLPFHVIARLPLSLQVAFRLKMHTIFALQLLVVGLVVTTFRFHPEAKRLADDFFTPPVTRLVLAFAIALALLVTLYLVRNVFPLNWALLLFFTGAQSLCFVGLGVVLDTNIGVFNCAFTFICVVIMIVLSGVRRKMHYSMEQLRSGATPETEHTLLSSFYAGAIAYCLVALAASALFLVYGRDLVTNEGFGYSLGFQLVLLLWFAYDASAMYKVMSPDEYMHGVIYFYTDLILLVLITAAIAVCAAIGSACSDNGCDCGSSHNDCDCFFYHCDCNCFRYNSSGCNCCRCDCGRNKNQQNQQLQPQDKQQAMADTEMDRV